MNIEKLTFLMHAAAGYSVVNFRYKRMKRIEVASEAKPKLFCPYSLTIASIFFPVDLSVLPSHTRLHSV